MSEPQQEAAATRGAGPPGFLRELYGGVAGLLPWGHPEDSAAAAAISRSPVQVAVQTVLVTAAAGILASIKIALYGGATPGAWMILLVLLTVPLTFATAAKPARARRALGLGVAAGLAVGVVVLMISDAWLDGFWWLFAAISAAFATANLVFAFVAVPVQPTRGEPEPQ